jgi:uncharacterized membrane protein YeaQ/YmgE (transglycosylase-associated protein family)
MYLILWIIFGGFIGWLASLITRNNKRMGLILNIIVGLIGSFLGGVIANFFQLGRFDTFSIWGMAFSLLGAVLFLMLINFLRRKRLL